MWCHSTTTFENFLRNLLKLFVSITLRACKIKREESSNKSWYINAINTSGDCRQSLESPQDFRKSLRIFATATLHYRWLFSYLVREPRITLILAWSTTLSFSIEKQRNKCPVTKKRLEFKNSLRRENDTFWQSVELLYHVRFFRRILKVLLNFFSFLAFSPCEWSPFSTIFATFGQLSSPFFAVLLSSENYWDRARFKDGYQGELSIEAFFDRW